MPNTLPLHDQEAQLLREIGELSDQIRALRSASAAANGTQIKAVELQSRSKWAELRALRATPTGVPPSTAGRGTWG